MIILVLLLALSFVDAQFDHITEDGWVMAQKLSYCGGKYGVDRKKLAWVAGMDVDACARAVTADAECGLEMYFTRVEGKETCGCAMKGHPCELKSTRSTYINMYYNEMATYKDWEYVKTGYCNGKSSRKNLAEVSGGPACMEQAEADADCGDIVYYVPKGGLCRCVLSGHHCSVRQSQSTYIALYKRGGEISEGLDLSLSEESTVFMAENQSPLPSYALHGLSAIGFLAVVYGAGMHFFGKSQTHEEL